MAISDLGTIQNLKAYFSLGKNINKAKGDPELLEQAEGVISDKIPELKLDLSDDELLKLSKTWKSDWHIVEGDLSKRRKENEKYWMGKQFHDVMGEHGRPLVDNLIFEALETFLPIATRQNPEPLVDADNSEEGIKLANDVKKMLAYLADTLRLKLSVKQAVRFWSLYLVGVVKVGWSMKEDDINLKVVRPQKLILDPTGTIENGKYTGEYIGEYRDDSASNLVKRFSAKKAFIEGIAGKKKGGTKIQYIEWWTDDFVFWELGEEVLDKARNPHFNYEKEEININEETLEEERVTVDADNHFKVSQMPYVLLSVFNLGLQPWDTTSLIEQNLPLQDLINKRERQIDKNVDGMNGGWVVSGERAGLTKEQASQATEAIKNGGVVWIPTGTPSDAIQRFTGTGLPGDVFNNLQDARNELRGIFGVTGLQPQGIQKEDTVRGKILNRGSDVDRIGGGIAEYIEQFVDEIYNWWVQLMYVYYTEEHSASVLGNEGGREYITLKNADLNRKLRVSVKEGSLIPTDSMTKRNEAVDLWGAGALDPITLYNRLEFPDPRGSAEKLVQWLTNPAGLLQDGAQTVGQPLQGQLQQPLQHPQQQPGVAPEQANLLNNVPIQ